MRFIVFVSPIDELRPNSRTRNHSLPGRRLINIRGCLMRYLAFALMLHVTTASAEAIKIPWKREYTYTSDATYSPENKWASGRSRNFMNGAPEENGKVQRDGFILGEFIPPNGTAGPVAVVILMHGCSGMTSLVSRTANEKAKLFLSHQIGVLILDSFTTRKVKSCAGAANYHWGWRRVEDAYSALHYLIENKLALPDRVYVMGRSNGGSTALMLATSGPVTGHLSCCRFDGHPVKLIPPCARTQLD